MSMPRYVFECVCLSTTTATTIATNEYQQLLPLKRRITRRVAQPITIYNQRASLPIAGAAEMHASTTFLT